MILYIFIGLCLGIVLFIATVKAYILGLQHGKQLINGNIPKVEINPVQAVLDIKKDIEMSKEQQEEMREIEMMFAYNGDIPKEHQK